ncbi:FG-GAP repeat domain-containing protein [Actinoplanes friuliensis]|uniref:FG-GAP repeat domain-containing protein n=1 Tax=Actinoplanes friuliensis TaxID=196914 RepID=UPI0005A10234|nr:VCBS repeat-containing protein [Actinoplanes friuliensis]
MRSPALPRVLVAVTLAAGSGFLAAPARAEGPLVPAAPALQNAPIRHAPCVAGGPTRADKKTADRVRSSLNGRRLGRSVSAQSISCARAIVRNVQASGLGWRAAVIAVTTAITESTLHNYVVAVDHDSLGLFQQRPSSGWGRPGQLVDPGYATRAFLNAMIRKHPSAGWTTGDIGQICQRVQGSAYPEAYAPEVHDAQLIVAELWTRAAAPDPTGTAAAPAVVDKPKTPKKPKGPFQNPLVTTVTGMGSTDARSDMVTADWNANGTTDLAVVQRNGTGSGQTELFIFEGAPTFQRHFQRLLLHTATVLGPTDERHSFSLADWNGDGRLDLFVVQKSGTASGRTELRIVDGASSFRSYLLEVSTGFGPGDDRHAFSVADWNADGKQDLVMIQKSGNTNGRTDIRVLDGASNFQRYLVDTPTALGPTDDRHEVSVTDWNADRRLDLVVVQKSGTASRKTEVRVLDGASTFRRTLVKATTAQGPADDRHELLVTDWNRDGRPDLMVVQKADTVSGWTEARVLAG